MTEAEKEHLVSKARDAYTALRKKYRRYWHLGVISRATYQNKLARLEMAFYEREQAIVDEFKRIQFEPRMRYILPKAETPLPPSTYDVFISDVRTSGKIMTIKFDF